jgi:hypothetical protein
VADYLMRREFTLAEKMRQWTRELVGDIKYRTRRLYLAGSRIVSAQENCTCIKPC